jgi:hypothetical protein
MTALAPAASPLLAGVAPVAENAAGGTGIGEHLGHDVRLSGQINNRHESFLRVPADVARSPVVA